MKKTDKTRETLLEQLKRTPIVQVACEKLGVSRATFYRWKAEEPGFAEAAEAALREGALLVNDLAESQLIGAIKDSTLGAITYWLQHHHKAYANRLEVSGRVDAGGKLTPEQRDLVDRALRLAAINTKVYGEQEPDA